MNSNWSDSPESSIPLKISDICPLWPCNFTDDLEKQQDTSLFYATSRVEHHFIAICEFELELQFEKSQFGVKIYIF